jgi:hypothetical protein
MHRVTSRILMGPELCRNKDYIDLSLQFSESIFVNGLTLAMIPMGPFRKVGSWIGSWRHRRRLESVLKVVLPIVHQRLATRSQNPSSRPSLDAIEWTIDLLEGTPSGKDARRIALYLLHNLWAGSAAPGGLVTQMVYQMLLEPKYLEPLRTEARKALSRHRWTDKALSDMPLQDSFIREINRIYPTGSGWYLKAFSGSLVADLLIATCARTVVEKPFRFYDGLELPVGSRIAIPALAIQQDAGNFKDPLVFDGFRSARLHPTDSHEHQHGATNVSATYLA